VSSRPRWRFSPRWNGSFAWPFCDRPSSRWSLGPFVRAFSPSPLFFVRCFPSRRGCAYWSSCILREDTFFFHPFPLIEQVTVERCPPSCSIRLGLFFFPQFVCCDLIFTEDCLLAFSFSVVNLYPGSLNSPVLEGFRP